MNLLGEYVTAKLSSKNYATQGLVTAVSGDGTMTVQRRDGGMYTCEVKGAVIVVQINERELLDWIAAMKRQYGL